MSAETPADIAYEALRRAIIEQAIAPGTKLPEDELATQFGISRTPVRALLARLQTEGLVVGGNRRTASVATPSLGEARQVFAVRRALEREAVRLVGERWRAGFARQLEHIVREEEAARDAGDQRASIRLAGDFHIALADMADNFLLRRYLSETVSRCSLILAVHSRPHSQECAISEHHGILDCLCAGRYDEAMVAMDAHIDAIARRASLTEEKREPASLVGVLSRYTSLLRGEGGKA
jgi:DNA-binding GntR family transcriptional regulator